MKNKIYINFGAGNPIKYWLNMDSSPFFLFPKILHFFIKTFDLSSRSIFFLKNHYQYFKFAIDTKLPFEDNTVDAIYTSHVQEHLSIEENKHFFSEAHRTLKKGGILRILVPNLEKQLNLNKYMFSLENELLTLPINLKSNKIRAMLEAYHGFPSFHKTIFVRSKLKNKFSKNWIVSLDLKYLESKIPKRYLKNVEQESRTKNAIIFELIKK